MPLVSFAGDSIGGASSLVRLVNSDRDWGRSSGHHGLVGQRGDMSIIDAILSLEASSGFM